MTAALELLTEQVAALSAQVQALQERVETLENRDSMTLQTLSIRDETGRIGAQLFSEGGETRLVFLGERGIACELRSSRGNGITPGDAELLFASASSSHYGTNAIRLGLQEGHGSLEIFSRDAVPAVLIRSLDSGGAISVVDESGKVRVLMRNEADGGMVEVFGPDYNRCATLSALAEGGMLALSPPGRTPLFIAVGAAGGAMLSIEDESTDVGRVRLAVNEQISIFQMSGPDEQGPHISMNVMSQQASMDIAGAGGANLLSLSAQGKNGAVMLKDTSGQQRAALEMTGDTSSLRLDSPTGDAKLIASCDQSPLMALQDASGDHRLIVHTDEKGARFTLYDDASTGTNANGDLPRVLLSSEEGNGQLHLFGWGGSNTAAVLRGDKNGGSLALMDGHETPRALLWNDEEGAILELNGADGTRRLGLMARDVGGQMAAMSDSGTPRVTLGVAGDHGQLAVSASGGDVVVALSASDEGGKLILADGDGIAKLELPDDAPLL
jgi:hypothetical protein